MKMRTGSVEVQLVVLAEPVVVVAAAASELVAAALGFSDSTPLLVTGHYPLEAADHLQHQPFGLP